MRVVHIIDSGGYYGAEVMLVHLCNAQKQLGIDVEVISIGTPGTYEKPLETILGENNIACKPWRMRALPDLRQSYKIVLHCKANHCDVVHSHGYKGNILLGLLPRSLRRKIPIVSTLHGYTHQKGFGKLALNQWLDKQCLPRLDAVVLVSEGMRHQISHKGPQDHVHVIANGIPEEIPTVANQPPEENLGNTFTISSIGRLSKEKNFQLLIRSMPLILEKVPNARLVIYGEGEERNALESLIAQLKLEQIVRLPGYIAEPARVYRHADLFVNCSTTEGMPITILEAMREGCPIVATDIPANKSLLGEINDAAILTSFREADMAEAIDTLRISLQSNRERIKFILKSTFKKNYTAEAMARNYLGLYQNLTQ